MNRIRTYRQQRGWSLQQLAEASGTSKSQIDKLEKGARRLTVDWMVRLAKPLGCDPRDLMEQAEDLKFEPVKFGTTKAPGGMIPLRGWQHGKKKKTAMLADKPIDYVPRPYYLSHSRDAYALVVADESMMPMYRPRQILFVNPYKSPAPCCGIVVIGKNGAVTIRELVGLRAKTIKLREYHPKRRDKIFALKDIATLHAVVGTVEA